MQPLIVAGIGTNVGKTIVSSILVEAFSADYWKPIQTGRDSDRKRVAALTNATCHPESYIFSLPFAAHHAARLDGKRIDHEKIKLPDTKNPLIIECCGGVMSPLTENFTQLELFSNWSASWILVVQHYLGSINHTLLSLSALQGKCIGIIFNGKSVPESEEFILAKTEAPLLGTIPYLPHINRRIIQWQAKQLLNEIVEPSGTLS